MISSTLYGYEAMNAISVVWPRLTVSLGNNGLKHNKYDIREYFEHDIDGKHRIDLLIILNEQ